MLAMAASLQLIYCALEIYIINLWIHVVLGYSNGAPCLVQYTMQPDPVYHAEEGQSFVTNPPPFRVRVLDSLGLSVKTYQPGVNYTVRLTGSMHFRGFLMQPRLATPDGRVDESMKLGHFIRDRSWDRIGIRYMDCVGTDKDAITHSNLKKKYYFNVKWRTEKAVGPVQFVVTLVVNQTYFWVQWKPENGLILPDLVGPTTPVVNYKINLPMALKPAQKIGDYDLALKPVQSYLVTQAPVLTDILAKAEPNIENDGALDSENGSGQLDADFPIHYNSEAAAPELPPPYEHIEADIPVHGSSEEAVPEPPPDLTIYSDRVDIHPVMSQEESIEIENTNSLILPEQISNFQFKSSEPVGPASVAEPSPNGPVGGGGSPAILVPPAGAPTSGIVLSETTSHGAASPNYGVKHTAIPQANRLIVESQEKAVKYVTFAIRDSDRDSLPMATTYRFSINENIETTTNNKFVTKTVETSTPSYNPTTVFTTPTVISTIITEAPSTLITTTTTTSTASAATATTTTATTTTTSTTTTTATTTITAITTTTSTTTNTITATPTTSTTAATTPTKSTVVLTTAVSTEPTTLPVTEPAITITSSKSPKLVIADPSVPITQQPPKLEKINKSKLGLVPLPQLAFGESVSTAPVIVRVQDNSQKLVLDHNDIDFCASNPCAEGSTCTNLKTDYACICPYAVTGKNCEEKDFCIGVVCQNQGICSSTNTTFKCNCVPGWLGYFCEKPCSEDLCRNGGTCYLDGSDTPHCRCVDGWTGSDCGNEINECESDPCQNGGTCNDGFNGFRCSCPVGFSGKRCHRPCIDVYQSCGRWDEEERCLFMRPLTTFFDENCAITCQQCTPNNATRLVGLPLAVALEPFTFMLGRWTTNATEFHYPTNYAPGEEYTHAFEVMITGVPMFGAPSLNVTSVAFSHSNPNNIYESAGFLTLDPRNEPLKAALLTVHNNGLTLIEEGEVSHDSLTLESVFSARNPRLPEGNIPKKMKRKFASWGAYLKMEVVIEGTDGQKQQYTHFYVRQKDNSQYFVVNSAAPTVIVA